MKTTIRHFCIFMLVMVKAFSVIPMAVSANSPVAARSYGIHVSNLPEGAVYVDLLIPMEETDPYYCEVPTVALPEGFSQDAQIITYCEDGYRSYTFHYTDAQAQIIPEILWESEPPVVKFFQSDMSNPDAYRHLEDVEARGMIRVAVLDAKGNVLQVSETCDLRAVDMFSYSLNMFRYDGSSNRIEIETAVSVWRILAFVALSVVGLIVTCIVERLVAWPFGMGKHDGDTIILTNIVSQIAMRVLSVVLYGRVIMNYAVLLLLLECLVYVGEYLFYRKKMQSIPKKKIILYTVCANTASLVIGWLLNLYTTM